MMVILTMKTIKDVILIIIIVALTAKWQIYRLQERNLQHPLYGAKA